MLNSTTAMATVAVKDIKRAKQFYEGTLGLAPQPGDMPNVARYSAGAGSLLLYESPHAGTNRATSVTWPVADVDGEVRALKGRGVTFEQYDIPDATREGDVHVMGAHRAAWFKDPDGNIHAIVIR